MAYPLIADRKDLGGFSVSRILPNPKKKLVGPFFFFDHLGPVEFSPGQSIDVRPHPHIGLATLSYLYEGSILHRDSLGYVQEILPGDVNWMTAGKGIVHSERQSLEVKGTNQRLNLIQLWVALPKDKAEIEPSFQHIPSRELPNIHRENVHMRLIAGEAYGHTSPVRTHSPMHYLDVLAQANSRVERPNPDSDCAVYLQSGSLTINGTDFSAGDFVVLDDMDHHLEIKELSRFLLLGGPAFDETPKLYWNFVAYSGARMEAAKQQWLKGDFPKIPTDSEEFIPLP